MLKRKALRKIIITTFVFFVVLTIYMIPSNNKNNNEIIYHYIDTKDISVYLLNNHNQLTKVDFKINNDNLINTVRSVINKLTVSIDATIPNGFVQVIPNDVKLNNITIKDGLLCLDFSEAFLEVPSNEIETVVESISYSLFNIDGIDKVSIYVLDKNISDIYSNIPRVIDKKFGINKRLEIKSLNDISKVTIFYIDNIDDNNYYVPVTKYVNDKRDKIKIIIDELSSSYIYESNLISLLNKNIKLLDYEIKNDAVILDFSNSIFLEQNDMLEEIVYSVFANYDVNEVVFNLNDRQITKKRISF